jgi:hypothetical protein
MQFEHILRQFGGFLPIFLEIMELRKKHNMLWFLLTAKKGCVDCCATVRAV